MIKTKVYLFGSFALICASGCILNVIITVQLTFSNTADHYLTMANFHSKRKTFKKVVICTWLFLAIFKSCYLFYQYIKDRQPISDYLMASAFDYLLVRLEIAVVYLGLKTENLTLRFHALNTELELWLPLDQVLKINCKHHKLINEIQETSRVGGSIFFFFFIRCIVTTLIMFYALIFIKSDEVIIKLLVWSCIKHITTYFVS